MSSALDIGYGALAAGYLLILIPLAIMLYLRVSFLSDTLIALVRMTLQLLFVGFYLQFVFNLNLWWLNFIWLLVMVLVANLNILNNSRLRRRTFLAPMFVAMSAGMGIPLLYMIGVILRLPNLFEAQYFIPLAGMIMGNCLRSNIVGMRSFYGTLKEQRPAFLLTLSQGASLWEALLPHVRRSFEDAIAPAVSGMATIGLVALPGMMTGIIMGGTNPMTAIKYQIAIMIAIFTGQTLSVFLGIVLTLRRSFTPFGVLRSDIFRKES